MIRSIPPLLTEISRPTLYLLLFALAGTLILAGIHAATQQRIAANEQQALLKQVNSLIDPNSYDNQPLLDRVTLPAAELHSATDVTVYRAKHKNEPVAAIYVISSPNGYSGTIRMVVGIKTDQTLGGVRVVAHKETPGLGDRIEETRSDWIHSFSGKSLQNPALSDWAVKKDGGQFDQFTGATITPRAIVNSVKQVLLWSEQHQTDLFKMASEAAHEETTP